MIHLFGPFEAWLNGRPLPRLRSRKGQWLLALLALRGGGEAERRWLAALLWPDSSESQALANLRLCLKDLRQALGAEAARLRAPTPGTLSLDLDGAEVDVLAFDQAVARGDLPSLEQAVALYRGPLLQGSVEEWAFHERQVREQAYLQALERLADQAFTAGDRAGAERYLRRVITVEPLRETAHRALMRALAAGGNYAAALLAYRDLRHHLYRELNTGPDPATQALFLELRDEARRRATDTCAGEAPETPAGPARAHLPNPLPRHNLPAPVTPLIGREREVAAVESLLGREVVRLVTLAGPGGTGKTRLALHIASGLVDLFLDGVFLVDLAPITEPDLVAVTIAQTLGLREEAGKPLVEAVKAQLRERQILLLLDNFEQVLPAATLISELLAGCPRLKVLVTSRAPLRLRGEHEFPVAPLALPDPACLPTREALSQYAAVELFIQRSVAVRPEFEVTNESAPAVAEICHRLDGLPLAIELAAARSRLFAPEALLARLSSRLTLLTDGARDLPARQQTLRRAIGWSYDLLEEPEQRLFRRLAVFAGGWTLGAAQAVCADARDEIPAGLCSLAEQNLIHRVEGDSEEPRFRMLETIREFGLERLEDSGEAGEIRRRHAGFFAATTKSATQSERWLARLRAEVANYRAAFSWALATAELETAFRLAQAIGDIWTGQFHWSEVRERLAELLDHPKAAEPSVWRARALFRAGQAAWWQGDVDEARRLFEEEATIGQALTDPTITCDALFQLGMLEISHGDREAARALHAENVRAGQSANDLGRYHRGLHGLAALAEAEGDTETAQRYYEELLAAFGGEQDQSFMSSWWRHGMGAVALLGGDYARARDLLEASLERFRAFGDQWAISKTLTRLAQALWRLGDRVRAIELCHESLRLAQKTGDRQAMSLNLDTLAAWAAEEGRMDRAARLFGAAAALREACHAVIWAADRPQHDTGLAQARVALGEAEFAEARQRGQATPLDQVVAEALEEVP